MVRDDIIDDDNRLNVRLYPKWYILGFSLLFSGIGGAILFGINLKGVDKKKEGVGVFLLILTLTLFGNYVLKQFEMPSLIKLMVNNVLSAWVLFSPLWKHHFNAYSKFKNRNMIIPVCVVFTIIFSLMAMNYFLR